MVTKLELFESSLMVTKLELCAACLMVIKLELFESSLMVTKLELFGSTDTKALCMVIRKEKLLTGNCILILI